MCYTNGMFRYLGALFFVSGSVLAGNLQLLSGLPSGAVAKSVRIDNTGNIYVAGSLLPQTPKADGDSADAFVAKLSADGSTLLYLAEFGGSASDQAAALTLGSDGSAVVTGSTNSADFPITASFAVSRNRRRITSFCG